MECIKALDMMNDYIDGQLNKDETELFEKHLQSCEACKSDYEFMNNIIDKLHSIEEVEVPETLHDDIMRKIQHIAPSKARFTWVKPITSFVAAAFLLFVIFSVFTSDNFMNFTKSDDSAMMTASDSAVSESSNHSTNGIMSKLDGDQDNRQNNEVTMDAPEMFEMMDASSSSDDINYDTTVATSDAASDTAISADSEEYADSPIHPIDSVESDSADTDGTEMTTTTDTASDAVGSEMTTTTDTIEEPITVQGIAPESTGDTILSNEENTDATFTEEQYGGLDKDADEDIDDDSSVDDGIIIKIIILALTLAIGIGLIGFLVFRIRKKKR